jgi:ribosome recycling factor
VISQTLNEADTKMKKAVEVTREDFAAIRTGRANPSMFHKLTADYYGSPTPLQQLASFTAPEPRVIIISPYDASAMSAIEKSIRDSDLGLNPSNDGNLIRLSIPPLTEERRRDLVKVVRHIAEEGRVKIRNVRRDVMHDLRELREGGDVGEDEERRAEAELQKVTDAKVADLESHLKGKEAEILEV